MAVRESKRALAEVAAMLGTDTASARSYLRRVQQLAGPVPYEQIAAAMRTVEGHDERRVAELVTAGKRDRDRTAAQPQRTDG